ncbi:hypothetical protein [Roseateles cavernae]|uniref:hypothetical protein n=1 Tax=Roseateles cavernae TaxID=3153578 RepID=UPI0032E37DF3
MKHLIIGSLLLGLLAAPSWAQEAGTREREALRRAQSALRDAQRQQATLQAEKATLERERAQLAAAAETAASRQRGSAGRLEAREQELDTLRSELAALRQRLQQAEQSAQAREQGLQQELLAQRHLVAERGQTVQALSQLLERSTSALVDSEAKNRQLHAIGEDLVQRYLSRSPTDVTSLSEPLLGLAAIRFENVAEELRAQLAQHRVLR